MDAATMKEVGENPVSSRCIARNYIPKAMGLEAVAYCEKMAVHLDLEDLQQVHDLAIQATRIKFAKDLPALYLCPLGALQAKIWSSGLPDSRKDRKPDTQKTR